MKDMAKRRCAFIKCGREFTPTTSCQKHCQKKCGTLAFWARSWAERRARKATKPQRHPKARFIYEALEETEPGMCPWGCEKRLPPRCRTCCRDPECIRAYQRAYRLGRTRVEQEQTGRLRTALCACGCGTSFTTCMPARRHRYVRGHRPLWRKARAMTFAEKVRAIRGSA